MEVKSWADSRRSCGADGSPALRQISTIGRQMTMVLRNGDTFSMPLNDCLLLPLRHTSAEEIARWMVMCSCRGGAHGAA